MALEATTIANNSGGTVTSTNNSHDNSTTTYDDVSPSWSSPETIQWGFGDAPVDWKKFRLRTNVYYSGNFGVVDIYIIPTGETSPANYTNVYSNSGDEEGGTIPSNGVWDVSYEHGTAISADGIYIKVATTAEAGQNIGMADIDCWHEASASGYANKVNSVASASIGKINSIATASIGKVSGV